MRAFQVVDATVSDVEMSHQTGFPGTWVKAYGIVSEAKVSATVSFVVPPGEKIEKGATIRVRLEYEVEV